ncbi:hypothetical protein FH972_023331 [Carpinus fangiana]|uniref:Major facilitator superfamily (MFS) profile domain-containing protein n=1 Tax=Carpinus fangiana TaxID=176857 RepID=A0A5N6KVA6_9ROSI|nr:hypothetical protein FH972_023331 [Carpinus fangiana]
MSSGRHRYHERVDSRPSVYESGDEQDEIDDLDPMIQHVVESKKHRNNIDSDGDSAYGSDDQSHDSLLPAELREGDARTHEDEAISLQAAKAPLEDTKPVSWLSLPRKDQLIILTLIRLAEPITQTSLMAYMFYMLKSFDGNLSDAAISAQVGLLSAAFTGAQAVTAMIWGGLADKAWVGRKRILLIGLFGTFVATFGFGFSKSFFWAMFFRTIGGGLNGNVGVMRTMISEIVVEKKFQPKAFLLMPVTFNVGVLVGPILGGWLQDPVQQYPSVFPKGGWLEQFPYALPNVVTSVFLASAFALVFFGLEETHIDRRHRPDWGLKIGQSVGRACLRLFWRRKSHAYTSVESQAGSNIELGRHATHGRQDARDSAPQGRRPQLPYRRIFTRNVVLTLCTHGLFALNVGAFNTLWFIFLSTPRFDPAHPEPPEHTEQRLPFKFTGGLGLPPPTIGMAIAIIGVFGLCMQFGVYSRVTHKLGVLPTFRLSNMFFPIAYTLAPLLVMLPTRSAAPHAADGPWMWVGICCLLAIQVTGRTFSLPITQILINNCTPHPSVLGTMHGIGTSVSAATRTFGPILWTLMYGYGLEMGVVGLACRPSAVETMPPLLPLTLAIVQSSFPRALCVLFLARHALLAAGGCSGSAAPAVFTHSRLTLDQTPGPTLCAGLRHAQSWAPLSYPSVAASSLRSFQPGWPAPCFVPPATLLIQPHISPYSLEPRHFALDIRQRETHNPLSSSSAGGDLIAHSEDRDLRSFTRPLGPFVVEHPSLLRLPGNENNKPHSTCLAAASAGKAKSRTIINGITSPCPISNLRDAGRPSPTSGFGSLPSFPLLCTWIRALQIMKRNSVADDYLDPMASTLQCLRGGEGYRKFLVFAALTKSKKGNDYIALFAYFQFRSMIRIILAQGPRQVINAITLYSVMHIDKIFKGNKDSQDNSDNGIAKFWSNIEALANEDTQQAVILLSMLFTFVIWVFSALSLIVAFVLYITFLWHFIPREDGTVSAYCRRKIEKRLENAVRTNYQKALEKEEAKRKKAEVDAMKFGRKPPPPARRPTLPLLDDKDSDVFTNPGLSRSTTESTLPPYAARPDLARMDTLSSNRSRSTMAEPKLPDIAPKLPNIEEKEAPSTPADDQEPTLPVMQPALPVIADYERPQMPPRTFTEMSNASKTSVASDAPLLARAGDMGSAENRLLDNASEAPMPSRPSISNSYGRPLPGAMPRSSSARPMEQSANRHGRQPPPQRSMTDHDYPQADSWNDPPFVTQISQLPRNGAEPVQRPAASQSPWPLSSAESYEMQPKGQQQQQQQQSRSVYQPEGYQPYIPTDPSNQALHRDQAFDNEPQRPHAPQGQYPLRRFDSSIPMTSTPSPMSSPLRSETAPLPRQSGYREQQTSHTQSTPYAGPRGRFPVRPNTSGGWRPGPGEFRGPHPGRAPPRQYGQSGGYYQQGGYESREGQYHGGGHN